MLAFYIMSDKEEPTRMDINMAFCNSTIRNARQDVLPEVEVKLKEIIENATEDLDSFPKGVEELRKSLLQDGMTKVKNAIE